MMGDNDDMFFINFGFVQSSSFAPTVAIKGLCGGDTGSLHLLCPLGNRDRFGGNAGGFSSDIVRFEIAPLNEVEFEEKVAVVDEEDNEGVPLPYVDK